MNLSSMLRTAVSGSLAVVLSLGLVSEVGASTTSRSSTVVGAASPIEIYWQPVSVNLSSPGRASFQVLADSSGASLSYQWQRRRLPGGWQNISGARQNNYAVLAGLSHSGLQYRVMISNGHRQISSHIVGLTVIGTPTFTRQPASARGTENGRVTLSVAASGNQIHYRWQRKAVGGSWKTIDRAVQASLIVNTTSGNHGAQYRALADNPNGRAISRAATVSVVFNKVRISGQPRSIGVSSGQLATFRVSAVGSGARYQWQRLSGGKWVTVVGATSSSYGIRASIGRNGWTYRVIVSSRTGSVTSQAVRLVVSATRSDPWKVGTSVSLLNWRVKESYVNSNARSWLTSRGFGQTPALGRRYVAATFVITNIGQERLDPWLELNVEFVGTDGRTYDQVLDYMTDFDQLSIGDTYPGGSASFTAVAEIPTGVSGGSWNVEDDSDWTQDRATWFTGR